MLLPALNNLALVILHEGFASGWEDRWPISWPEEN